jgi:hypothetical protein
MNIRRIILEELRSLLLEGLEHTQNLYKSWANKKSGNPEAAMKIMDDVLKYQKRLPKKDFSQYSSYEELVSDLNKIKQSLKPEDVTKLYEDKDLVVLVANTWEASCKYGAGTKWCTTAKDTSSYWKRHNETGTEFFWIFKNIPNSDPNYKFSYHIKLNGNTDWCNAINNCQTNLPEDSYPKQHPKYGEILVKLRNFHDSRNLVDRVKKIDDMQLINREFVSALIEREFENIVPQILSWTKFDVGGLIEDIFYNEMDILSHTDSIMPINVEYREWMTNSEIRKIFFKELEKHLESELEVLDNTYFLSGYDFESGLKWLFMNILSDIFDPTLPYEEQMREGGLNVYDILPNISTHEIEEILFEVISVNITDFIHDESTDFALKYIP